MYCSLKISLLFMLQVTQETTIGNSNPALWKYITPNNTVVESIRNVVANRLASNGAEWATIFSQHNSGT